MSPDSGSRRSAAHDVDQAFDDQDLGDGALLASSECGATRRRGDVGGEQRKGLSRSAGQQCC